MKKFLCFMFVLLLCGTAYAADSKVTALDALTVPADEDLLYMVDDPSGTPVSKKITREDFFSADTEIVGNLSVNESLTVQDTIYTGSGGISVAGAGSNLSIAADGDVTIDPTDDFIITATNAGLDADGDMTLDGTLSVNDTLTVESLNVLADDLDIAGNATVQGNLTIEGTIYGSAPGPVSVMGDLSVNHDLTVYDVFFLSDLVWLRDNGGAGDLEKSEDGGATWSDL